MNKNDLQTIIRLVNEKNTLKVNEYNTKELQTLIVKLNMLVDANVISRKDYVTFMIKARHVLKVKHDYKKDLHNKIKVLNDVIKTEKNIDNKIFLKVRRNDMIKELFTI